MSEPKDVSQLPPETQVIEIPPPQYEAPPPPPYEDNVVILLAPRSKSITLIGILASVIVFMLFACILFIYVPSIIWKK